jgi:flagellar basal-body rod protein FlgB
MQIFDRTICVLEKALGLSLMRHNLIAANLANMDTPGYQARDFSFQDELKRALEVTPVKVGGPLGPESGLTPLVEVAPQVREEGVVDLDRETTRLAENTLTHDAVTRLMGKKFEMLKYAISEGGK